MNILAGSTLGGGTRVNWQASFQTPAHVRKEWATEHGLSAIASERYTAALNAVCTRLGVTTGMDLLLMPPFACTIMHGIEDTPHRGSKTSC